MKCLVSVALLAALAMGADGVRREAVYGGAVTVGGQIVPLFAHGYLVYVHLPNRLQVFRPDTQLAYEYDVPCPAMASSCSVAGIAVTRQGVVAVGIGYATTAGYTSAIRLLDPAGRDVRSFNTGRYVPIQLTFDKNGDLWSMGWERDELINDREREEPYNVVRKYSQEGVLKGEFLPKTLWPGKHGPHLGGRGYWTMQAANDRIGALVNANAAGATPEWIEWDLGGSLLSRTPLARTARSYARAFAARGRLYADFAIGADGQTELRVLDTSSGKWIPLRTDVLNQLKGFLLGADGDDLVYRLNHTGNVHLVWFTPD